ncbi:helix-turn-helix domain-containing protein [Streptomyces sp. NEAU-Y11]|uniref:helix-turn-helix domain-containing protein n=1 Tax=Streptomyces cucumeris TaxID=2962890 RepID=UPI0020C93984|nr:helix-turn-helix transcriptional regulator [Streptomyces sp. NEAU-Y11]MCP9210324.1 helix-turn-helix domain-containing protein [Streptomyces sp. NEAU-Y11]
MHGQRHQFGPELRRRRLAEGLTLDALAAAVHYSKGQLSKVERGLKPPSPDLARLCDAELGAGGALAALVPWRSSGADTDEEIPGDQEVWLMRLTAGGTDSFQPMDRRQVMAAGAAGAASALRLGPGTPSAPTAAEGSSLLEVSRSMFDQYRRLGQTVSPRFMLPALVAQTHTLRELARGAGARTRRGLLTLASRYAEYIGWLVQESGDEKAALWWTRRAVELAAAGGDEDLAAYALVRHALITLYRQDAAQTVELTRRAQSGAVPPRIHGLAAQREAQGHALGGDYDASMRCLDRARVLLARDAPDSGTPVIGTTNLPDPVAMVTGWCLYDLGRPREAAEIIDRELARIPPDALRTRARYGMRQALAHAAAGDLDHACELAGQLLDGAVAVGSATITADLRRLAHTLARHPTHPTVRALTPELTAALRLETP